MNGALRPMSRGEIALTVLVFLIAAYAFFFRLGCFGVTDGGESYYPAAVREMMESHSYVVPQMNYQLYFSKPIMTFWMLDLGYRLFGLNEFGGRAMSAFCGLALSLCMFAVTRAIAGVRAGSLAVLLFAGAPAVLMYYRTSAVDAFWTTFLGMALCGLLAVVCAGRTKWWPAIYLALGLAVLTKGPAAFVLTGAGLIASLLALRLPKSALLHNLQKLHPFKGTAILLAVALPWYLAVGVATKWLFLKVFLLYENLARFRGQTNPRPLVWYRYVVVIFAGLAPWSLLLPAAVLDVASKIRARFSTALAPKDNVKFAPLDAKTICICFAVAVIGLFSASKTQMEPYLLPAVPPLAIAIALLCDEWSKRISGFGRWSLDKLGLLAMLIGPVLPVGVLIFVLSSHLKAMPLWAKIAGPIVALLVGSIWFGQRRFLKGRLSDSMIAIAASMTILSGTFLAVGIETHYKRSHLALHNLCRMVRGSKEQVSFFGGWRPSVLYYTCGPVSCFYRPEQLKKSDDPTRTVLVMLARRDLRRFSPEQIANMEQVALQEDCGLYRVHGYFVEPNALLSDTFDKIAVSDFVFDRYRLGIMTDPLSEGRIPRVGTLNVK